MQEQGRSDYLIRIGGRAYRSGIWPTAISKIYKSTGGSHPYNQGENLPSMGEDHGDGMHSGGLPTTTVPKYYPYLHTGKVAVKQVQGTGMESHIKGNQG
jgi:hypothetical protein